MSFGDHLNFIKRLRLMLINEGPRDSAGKLRPPFQGWVARLETDIGLADKVYLTEQEKGEGDVSRKE